MDTYGTVLGAHIHRFVQHATGVSIDTHTHYTTYNALITIYYDTCASIYVYHICMHNCAYTYMYV